MQTASGISIVKGIAIGRIRCRSRKNDSVGGPLHGEPARELKRFEEARRQVQRQQRQLYEKASETAGEKYAEIFRLYAEILEDETLLSEIRRRIGEEKLTAQNAVRQSLDEIGRRFREMEDPYFRARETDILDIRNALLENLSRSPVGEKPQPERPGEPVILVGEDFTPSDTVRLDRNALAGLITREGSVNSHTAILARSMNLPTLVQCGEASADWNGKMAVLDGYAGKVYLDPTEEFLDSVRKRRLEDEREQASLLALRNEPTVTGDGKRILLGANIAVLSDVKKAKKNGAEKIGLFRSEFLYLNAAEEPSEEEQFQTYRNVLEEFAPGKVVIRTCDIGADKTAPYMKLAPEENPALGLRAVRICLKRKDFFRRQLRALLRASAYGSLEIMIPMITSVWEMKACRKLLEECRMELEQKGIPMAEKVPLGMIVETPAAALCAEELAMEADFFSIGTNDLTQYTCAADRQNQSLGDFFDPRHPAVLKEIRMTVEAAHRHGIRVGICGEMGSDPQMTEMLLRMGVDELSVNPSAILPLRKKIRTIHLRTPEEPPLQ